jgi:hypothetical protein
MGRKHFKAEEIIPFLKPTLGACTGVKESASTGGEVGFRPWLKSSTMLETNYAENFKRTDALWNQLKKRCRLEFLDPLYSDNETAITEGTGEKYLKHIPWLRHLFAFQLIAIGVPNYTYQYKRKIN